MAASLSVIADAQSLCAEGRFHAAASQLLDAFRASPEDAEIARELGAVMRASGDLQASVDYLERALSNNPTDARAVAEIVLAYHAMQKHEAASRILTRSLELGLRSDDLAGHLSDAA